jgi:gluconate 2-dehydrogenase alpha chain
LPCAPGTPRWGSAWKAANANWYLCSFGILAHGTSDADRSNYMNLDPDYRDAYGRPLMPITFVPVAMIAQRTSPKLTRPEVD